MTGAWLLANDLKQISDCTGGRKGDAVRYCQSEQGHTYGLLRNDSSLIPRIGIKCRIDEE